MITCIFGLTACGAEKTLSAADESNLETAKVISTEFIVPYLSNFFDDAIADEYLGEYNKEEMKYIAESVLSNIISMYSQYGYDMGVSKIYVDGHGFLSGITSFNLAHESMGDVVEIGEPTAKISGDEIMVYVPVTGTLKNAEAEIIFSNDLFLTVKASALNVDATMGDLMVRASLDTLLGMGTVFLVLILISFIISAMGLIPKMQAKFSKKNEKEELQTIKEVAVDNTIAQIIKKEEMSDTELVAVIAAAIAASQGATSTDGFVVRSIRKVRR